MLQGEVMGSSPPLPPPSLPPQPWAPPQLPQPHSRGSRPHSALPLSPRSFASQSLGVPSHKSLLFGSRPLGVPIPQLRAIDAPIPGLPAPWGSRPPPPLPHPFAPSCGAALPHGGSQSLGEIPTGGVPIPDPQPGAGGGFWGGPSVGRPHGAHRGVDVNEEPIARADHPVVLQHGGAAGEATSALPPTPPLQGDPHPAAASGHGIRGGSPPGVPRRSPVPQLPGADGEAAAVAVPAGSQHDVPPPRVALQQLLGLRARHGEEAAERAGGGGGGSAVSSTANRSRCVTPRRAP